MRKAVVDMGTNSMRLAIADILDGEIQMCYNEVAETRLGEGVGDSSILQKTPMLRNVKQLSNFLKTAEEYHPDSLRVIATSAVRDAANNEDFLQLVQETCNITVEILSGETEARMSYLGAGIDFDGAGKPLVVLDIGGGSTELVYPVGGSLHSASVNVGAVRLYENPNQEFRARLEMLVENNFPKDNHIIAVGGTNTCLAALDLELEPYNSEVIHGYLMPKEVVDSWSKLLFQLTLEERMRLPGMKQKRADIMPYGVRILQTMMEILHAKQVQISDKGLVYGLLKSDN